MACWGEDPLRLLVTYHHFPTTMARHYKRAFRWLGCEVISAGYAAGATIPGWPSADYSAYVDAPDLPIPYASPRYELDRLFQTYRALRPDAWPPDALIQFDCQCFFSRGGSPSPAFPNVLVATDPHTYSYDEQRREVDFVFITQQNRRQSGDRWLPNAFAPDVHYWIPGLPQTADICFIGQIAGGTRQVLIEQLQKRYRTHIAWGPIFQEANLAYNRAPIAFSATAADDLPQRFFEDLARGRLVVINRVPDLARFAETTGLREGAHYLAYSSLDELWSAVDQALAQPAWREQIAITGWRWVHATNQTYVDRARTILDAVQELIRARR